jgi:hypothetical protein
MPASSGDPPDSLAQICFPPGIPSRIMERPLPVSRRTLKTAALLDQLDPFSDSKTLAIAVAQGFI